MDIFLLQVRSHHTISLLFPGQDATMPAGMSVVQMDYSYHWLQMQSHLTIHSGLIPT